MAIELITGRAGTPHVDSADVGALNAALFGADAYVLEGIDAELVDANNVRVSAGEMLCEGRHIRITGDGETLTIENGTSAYKRNDIIAAHYLRDEDGMESVTLAVIKGAPTVDSPTDPAMPTTGKLIEGASEVYWPLYRVTINGLTPQAPAMMAHSWEAYIGRDAVVSVGVSGNTNWVKYASGAALCWLRTVTTIPINTAWGNMYRSTPVGPFWYPISFIDRPMTFCSARCVSSDYGLFTSVYSPAGTGEKSETFVALRPTAVTNSQQMEFTLFAIGSWK